MPHLRLDADRVDDLQGVHERLLLGVVGGVVRLVAAREVRPDAGHPQGTDLLGVGRRLHERGPLVRGGTATAEPGVDLELDTGPHAQRAGGRGDGVDLGHRVGGHVDVGLDRPRVVLAGDREPRQDAAGVAGRPQRERLLCDRGAQPVRTTGPSRASGLGDPVAVGVGLHDRHHQGVPDALLERRHVGADRVEVDDDLGAGVRLGQAHSALILPRPRRAADGRPRAVPARPPAP